MIQHIQESCELSSLKVNLIMLYKDNVTYIAVDPPGGRVFFLGIYFMSFLFPTFFVEPLDMMVRGCFWGREKGDWSGRLSGGRLDGIRLACWGRHKQKKNRGKERKRKGECMRESERELRRRVWRPRRSCKQEEL